ncbi:helicase domino-like [Culex pipiens pallens]|uniref:helicase domino-like n=1 Tax=Culex pipiens pallens TaxID=42434 RepID=UPI0022AA000B|nr:helicase domino-like [Culex pipiens pallens]
MNEGDSAGGQRGRNLALPAGTDRRISSISSAGHLPTTSPMSRSPADDRQQQFQNLQQQQHQQQMLTSPIQNKTIHQQQQFVSTVNLIPGAATVGTGITVGYQQQQHLVATNSGATNILVSGVNNDSASTILVPAGPGTQQNNSIAGSASGILVPNVNVVVAATSASGGSVFGGHSAGGNIYIQTGQPSGSAVISVVPSGPVGSVPGSPTTPRKRIKLEQQQSAGPVVEVEHDIATLKKLILEHKYMRLRNIKEKYSEHVAELFFLQSGGSMMEYPVWRKKPHTPAFVNFMRTYKLEPLSSNLEEAGEILKQQSNRSLALAGAVATTTTSLPQGAEIKIPGVGATPVAVSTQLPAAVAQLSQQGGTPIIPETIGIGGGVGGGSGGITTIDRKRHTIPTTTGSGANSPATAAATVTAASSGELSATISAASSTSSGSAAAVTTAAATSAAGSGGSLQQQNGTSSNSTTAGGNGQDQYTNKAKQEVYVMQRVQELQKEGMWSERRLPKVQEPPRPKAHWDYLLEEMVWLAADFAQERKWKKAAAKKCARMVQKHFQDKAMAAQRAEKAQELQLKRIAAFVAKEIKTFWGNVEKLVEYKQQTKLDEKRKKALDQQLSFIVDQTEKYSQQLVEGMNKTTPAAATATTSKANSLQSSRISSPTPKNTASDDEFKPDSENSDDDEETIAKAEAEATGTNEEVAALQKESEMDLDDFLKHLPKDYLENRDKIVLSDPDDSEKESESNDKDFTADEDSADEEDTIMEQESKEKNQDHKKEIDELNAENEMSIEELMAKYNAPPPPQAKKKVVEKMEVDSDDDPDEKEGEESTETEQDSDDEPTTSEDEEMDDTGKDEEDVGLKNLLDDEMANKSQSEKDEMLNDAAAIAESIQPKGNTLSSTSVVTPIPFLLKHTLREYQHIGLDWLVTMHDRKLNGILADEMGLGKTIQTISLLAHLACVKANWGPHLIIVPSSVMLNWEMEFKKWCPGFKILTYYGSQKERKLKRTGWTKVNAFHVCITSYKLVIQDHQSFRRKKWKYLILDEAQNIKNFKSQRWQLLLNFQTEQ